MKLYEIDQEILRLAAQIEFDEETGEILCDIDSIQSQIDSLQMERHSILTWLAKLVLNLRSEETRLKKRRERIARKQERLMHILDRECAGQKTDLGVATFSYRKTSRVDVADVARAVRWFKRNKHPECFRVPEPDVAKTEVRKLINSGAKVPGVAVIEDYFCQLK